MAIKLRGNVLTIENIQIEDPIVCKYVQGLPVPERMPAIVKAIGLGVLALHEAKLQHFLEETKGKLGKELSTLKTLYELDELQFKESSSRTGKKAEGSVDQALEDFRVERKYDNDEIIDLSRVAGDLDRNKTGDLLVKVDGKDECSNGFEVKFDKKIGMGELEKRTLKSADDTIIGQLTEMRANRDTAANVIVLDEDKVQASVTSKCPGGILYIPSLGFVVIVSMQRGDFTNLGVVYSISRELAKANIYAQLVDKDVLPMMVEHLLKLLNDYKKVEKEIGSIRKSADTIEKSQADLFLYIKDMQGHLEHYVETGEMSKKQMHQFYNGHPFDV